MTEQQYKKAFNEYYQPLRWFVTKITGELLAEDITCDCFLKLWEYREYEKTNVRAYLYTLARNASLNYLKSRRYRTGEPLPEPSCDDLEELMIRAELIRLVYKYSKSLHPQRRTIFDMLFFKGMKAREVAINLNISVDTVRVVKAQCLSIIRKRMIHV